MDNLTHSLVGLAAAKAGFEKLSPHATIVCVLAASLPDFDIVTLVFGGRWAFLHYHRHITHSIAGTITLALLFPLLFHLADRLIARIRHRTPVTNLRGLVIASVVVSITHPFMDWTNNYGIRLLLPWSAKWFYGDLVFIVDPFIWLLFGGAAFLLTSKTKVQLIVWTGLALIVSYLVMFGPAQRVGLSNPWFGRVFWIGGLTGILLLFKKRVIASWGAKIAIGAFAIAVFYWGSLAYIHSLALKEARSLATVVASQNGESIVELATMPMLANPLRWQTVFETERATYQFELSLGQRPDLSRLVRFERPAGPASQFLQEALSDRRAQIFLGFARFPVIQVEPNCPSQTLVQFADLRYTEPGAGRGTFSLDVPVECPP